MKIVLIGFMCSGKSKVGKLLAKHIGWPHFDTDEIIVKDVGYSIADIIKKRGEPAFRDIEKKTISLVSLIDKCVISTGGGAPLDEQNRSELSKNAEVVWLKVSPDTVFTRMGDPKSRPLIDAQDPLASIKKRLAEREPAYQTATHKIDTDQLKPEQVVKEILALIPAVSA